MNDEPDLMLEKLQQRLPKYLEATSQIARDGLNLRKDFPESVLLEKVWDLQFYASNILAEVCVFVRNQLAMPGETAVSAKYLALLLHEALPNVPKLGGIVRREAVAVHAGGSNNFDMIAFKTAQKKYKNDIAQISGDEEFIDWVKTTRNHSAAHHFDHESLTGLRDWILAAPDPLPNKYDGLWYLPKYSLTFAAAAVTFAQGTFRSLKLN